MRARSCIVLLALLFAAQAATAATLVVRAEGIRSAEGMVYVGVCAKGFDPATCPYGKRTRARAGTVEVSLPDVKPGRYAIAVYHDLNGNGKLDKTAFFPDEPYGFSNNVGRMAPPSFEGALINVADPKTVIIVPVR